jgi:guanine nucleotide-binding protein subunit beta-2-like 1 protein
MTWNLFKEAQDGVVGVPQRQFTGHNHFVTDVSLSMDGNFCISSSWDKTLRLWNIKTGKTVRQFTGHKKEVFTVSFSADNRQIISSGADKEIKLWNTLADCKYTSETHNHQDWVSQIRYSPQLKTQTKSTFEPYFASVGWDGRLKIWNTNFQIRNTFQPHTGQINTVAISPNAKYLATGGKDKVLNFWDVTDLKEPIRSIDTQGEINQILFHSKLQWVCVATEHGVKIWDLMSDEDKPYADLTLTKEQKMTKRGKRHAALSLAWNPDGTKLFAGFSDNLIHVW